MLYKTIRSFLPQYWLRVLPWMLAIALAVTVCIQYQKLHIVTPPPIKDNRIDSLEQVVVKAHADLLVLRAQYDSARTNARTEIEYIQIKNAKEINDISSYSVDQRDSLWATFNP
jgi:hypothetical protein